MKLKPLLTIILFSFIGLIAHKIFFYLLVPKSFENSFVYPVSLLYLGFGITSLIIVFVLIEIRKRNIDNVGYTYLWLTCAKMVVAYVFLRPILQTNLPKTPTEKMSFFIIFIYFLAIETIVTIRILNNKQ